MRIRNFAAPTILVVLAVLGIGAWPGRQVAGQSAPAPME